MQLYDLLSLGERIGDFLESAFENLLRLSPR
jgi:hypothetical protein